MRFNNHLQKGKIMNRFVTRFFLVFLVAILSLHFSCPKDQENDQENEDEYSGPNFPTSLSDPIPFDVLGQGKLVFERIGPLSNNYSGVYVIDVITHQSWGIGSGVFNGPAVSPNGQKIAFCRSAGYEAGTVYDVFIMDILGNGIQNVSNLVDQDRCPTWTPDSSQIVFWVESFPEQPVYRQSPVPNPVDRQKIKIFISWIIRGPFSVSQNLKLAFVAQKIEDEFRIHTMDIDGTDLIAITTEETRSTEDHSEYHSPSWSPDGKKIAYILITKDPSTREPKSMEVMLMGGDGGNLISLIKFNFNDLGLEVWSGENDISLCWSPDGTKIAFNKKDGHLESHIYIINQDGSDLTQVTFAEGVTDRSLSWSR